MVINVSQQYVSSIGIEKIQSEIFLKDHDFPPRDKAFILQNILSKRCDDIITKDLNRLKDIVRLHIPSSLRVQLWMLFTGGADVMKSTPNVYSDTCKRLFADGGCGAGEYDEYDDEQEMATYYLTEDGVKTVQKVLIVVKDLRPDVTYCPLLEPLIAVFLHFMDENQCYACISGLLSKKKSFVEQTKFDNALTDLSLQDLFRSINKKGYSRLKSFVMKGSSDDGDEDEHDASKIVLFPLWRNMIFGKLDFPIVVRIMDCLMVEGVKILYRIGLCLLNLFHSYSLSFQNMQFSDTQDLIATVAQYTQCLDDLTTDSFMKSAMKIKFTSKQLSKIHNDNSKLYKEQLSEYIQSDAFNKFTKQVIAVNLNKVSDIIKPVLWLQVCEWLPARIQLKQPYLLFSTNKDGFNLKTLYNLCEEEEQTLIILNTQNGETLGAYLSAPLSERHCGHNNLSYFGTGETFIFRLKPHSICYLWNKNVEVGCQHGKKSKYVFVEPAPIFHGKSRSSRRRSGARKSLMRRLSRRLSKTYERSHSTPMFQNAHDENELLRFEPRSAINLKALDTSNSSSGFEGKVLNSTTSAGSLAFHNGAHKIKSGHGKVRWNMSSIDLPDDASHIEPIHLATREPFHVVHPHLEFQSKSDVNLDHVDNHSGGGSDDGDSVGDGDGDGDAFHDEPCIEPPASLFISCDNSTFVVGGGTGQGLYFDGDINTGRSSRCDTYRNDSLSFMENGDFVITRLDVFGFN